MCFRQDVEEAKTVHSETKRIVPGAKAAVLFVHGIVSTPRFFDAYAAALPAEVSVHSVLLPGHGGSVRDFGRHSAKEWESHVRAALDALRAAHERVYIVAHSLGTLLAIREAVRDDARIAGMLLLCVPLRIWVKPSGMFGKLCKGVGLSRGEDLHRYYGIRQDWRFWRYAGWIPRYLELFAISRRTRQEICRLKVPSCVFMAQKDELVSLRSVKCMAEHPAITLRYLPGSDHNNYPPEDRAAIMAALLNMCGGQEQEAP